MDPIQKLRAEVDRLLAGQGAHADFDAAVAGFPEKLRGTRPPGAPHSAWELLEHLRLAQFDMLEFSRNPKHVSPEWPEGYWPKSPEPENAAAWDQSVKSFQHDLSAMRKLVSDPKSDLFTPFAARRRTDPAARGAAIGGSQRVPHRGVDFSSTASWRVEVKCRRKTEGHARYARPLAGNSEKGCADLAGISRKANLAIICGS